MVFIYQGTHIQGARGGAPLPVWGPLVRISNQMDQLGVLQTLILVVVPNQGAI